MSWQRLGAVDPARLAGARIQAHWAAQVLSAAGETLLPHVPDTSHTAMSWDAARAALVGREIPGPAPCRFALRVADLTLLLRDPGGGTLDAFALAGRTLQEGYAWLARAVGARLGSPLDGPLSRASWDLPAHPVADGRPFAAAPAETTELARWFANAALALGRLASATAGASPVRCWPHHFDLATLVVLRPGSDSEDAHTIGVGFSPGDAYYAEPYWYVTPYPHAEEPELPALAGGGAWHTQDFLGAVLPGSRLVSAGGADAQERRTREFLDSAVRACRALVAAA